MPDFNAHAIGTIASHGFRYQTGFGDGTCAQVFYNFHILCAQQFILQHHCHLAPSFACYHGRYGRIKTMSCPPSRIDACEMHGCFITGAYCFTNTIGCKYASAVTGTCGKKLPLMIKGSEVLESIVTHVFCHSQGQFFQARQGFCRQLFYVVYCHAVLFTAPTQGTPHQHGLVYHALVLQLLVYLVEIQQGPAQVFG